MTLVRKYNSIVNDIPLRNEEIGQINVSTRQVNGLFTLFTEMCAHKKGFAAA